MTEAERYYKMALWAENKANIAASSDKPWAMGNLRVYQNLASRFWHQYYKTVNVENENL